MIIAILFQCQITWPFLENKFLKIFMMDCSSLKKNVCPRKDYLIRITQLHMKRVFAFVSVKVDDNCQIKCYLSLKIK